MESIMDIRISRQAAITNTQTPEPVPGQPQRNPTTIPGTPGHPVSPIPDAPNPRGPETPSQPSTPVPGVEPEIPETPETPIPPPQGLYDKG